MGRVQVGAADAPVGREVLHRVALEVSLHGDQAAAELQAERTLVRRCPSVGPQVFDHGRVVSRALTTESTFKGFLSLRRRDDTVSRGRKVI